MGARKDHLQEQNSECEEDPTKRLVQELGELNKLGKGFEAGINNRVRQLVTPRPVLPAPGPQ